MTASVRCGVDIAQAERSGDEPGIETWHMAADHAHRRLVEQADQATRRVDAIARCDQRFGEARRSHCGGGNDSCAWVELIELHQLDAAKVECHPALLPVAIRAVL